MPEIMPIQATQEPVLATIAPSTTIRKPVADEMEITTSKYIKPSLIKYPVYEYQTGTTFFLSKKERIVADAYERSGNITEATRALNRLLEAHGSPVRHTVKVVKRWLQKKPHVSRYIADRLVALGKVNWENEDMWLAQNVDLRAGKLKWDSVQLGAWKEYGKARGWYKEQAPQMQTNVSLSFVQANGNR